MIQLIYISSATRWPTEADLVELLEQARSRNQKQNVTGMLLYHNATYLQVLEGDEKDVHEIFRAICDDERTTGVVKLLEETISQRDFPNWCMGFKNLDDENTDNLPGFCDIFDKKLTDIDPAQHQTAAKKLLLNFVRKHQ